MIAAERHYRVLSLSILALAGFNVIYRLGSETVTEWDESLYAISAWEMVNTGDWVATTFAGVLDYSNTKPPLNVWLIALTFHTFGTNLVSLRLASAGAAWFTVFVLQAWTRRCFGAAVALFSSLVLATTFAFIYVHSGRSGNPDALLTLLMLLTVVVLWSAQARPSRLVWLGPILAGVFLLKGMAVMMPLAVIVIFEACTARAREGRARPFGIACLLFAAAVAPWVVARWRLDEFRFFSHMFGFDFIARSVRPLDQHRGGVLYYFDIAQKHHYDWLVAAAVAAAIAPNSWVQWRAALSAQRTNRLAMLIAAWVGVTLLVPTMMQTKLPWYLNPFYPAFALGIGALLARGASVVMDAASSSARRVAFAGLLVVVFCVAEGRLLWYSYHRRDLGLSIQSVLIDEKDRLASRRVFHWGFHPAEMFVIHALVGAENHGIEKLDDFMRLSSKGDYLLASREVHLPSLTLVGTRRHRWLYRRE